jgi:putative phage-type endonuclease
MTAPSVRLPPLTLTEARFLDWLRASGKGVGGSDIGAICGFSPWGNAASVWDRIMEVRPPQVESPAMRRGTKLEPLAVEEYVLQTGRSAYPLQTCRPDRVRPWVRVSVDRMLRPCSDHEDEGVLEVKVLGERTFTETRTRGISLSYLCQLQWYMGALGRSWGSFACLHADAWALHWFDVAFQPDLYADLLARGTTFWEEHVLTRTRPTVDHAAPLVGIMPVGRVADALVRDDRAWALAVQQLLALREQRMHAESLETAAKQVVQSLMGDVETVDGGGARVTWKDSTTTSLDRALIAEEHPELDLNRYLRRTVSRAFRITPHA